MKSPFSKNTKTSPEKKVIRLNSRVMTFLICLLLSVFFWLMMSLSKEYVITLKFPVKYINLPQDKVLANQLPETIDVEINSTGFNLLVYKLKQHRKTILIDVKDTKPLLVKNHYYLFTGFRINKITEQFNNRIKIQKISPDTLLFNYNKKVTRRIPVKANLNITFDNHYQQTDSVQLMPDSIDISGAADVINKIDHVETVAMNLKKIANTVSVKSNLSITPELKLVDLSQPFVQAVVNVTKYTEGSVELPLEVENLPDGYNLKTFPDKITVKYNVTFNDYEKINALQFRAVIDYAKIEPGNNKLKINLVKYPEKIRAIKLSAEKVEFIIRK